jgi:hypothetical protein
MCGEEKTRCIAEHHRTCDSVERAMAELDQIALELRELVQAKTGHEAELECEGRSVRTRVIGGRAVGSLPPWHSRSLERCDPTLLELRWDLDAAEGEHVYLRVHFWLLEKKEKPDARKTL